MRAIRRWCGRAARCALTTATACAHEAAVHPVQMMLPFGRLGPYERWRDDYFAGTWLDFLDFISWVPGEIPAWPTAVDGPMM